jgi:hypothetical protein
MNFRKHVFWFGRFRCLWICYYISKFRFIKRMINSETVLSLNTILDCTQPKIDEQFICLMPNNLRQIHSFCKNLMWWIPQCHRQTRMAPTVTVTTSDTDVSHSVVRHWWLPQRQRQTLMAPTVSPSDTDDFHSVTVRHEWLPQCHR